MSASAGPNPDLTRLPPGAAPILIVMGVAGSGKTTIGRALAHRLDLPFYDADDFHAEASVAKMVRGEPLDDSDRAPWLARLARHLAQWAGGQGAVLACSALKLAHREALRQGLQGAPEAAAPAHPQPLFIHLHGSPELLARRLAARQGHFMPASLLASQFDALEPPRDALSIDVTPPVEQLVDTLEREIRLRLWREASGRVN